MTKTDAALECYLREVRDRLPCSRDERERILDRLRAGGEELLAAEPDADAARLREKLGAPEDIAAACIENTETPELLRRLRLRRRILVIVATVAAVVLLTWGAVVAWAAVKVNDQTEKYIFVTKGEIEYIPSDSDFWKQDNPDPLH